MDKSILDRLQKLIAKFNIEDPAPAPATFAEVTLADGSVLMYEGETPAEGAKVMMKNPEGEEMVAPDGEYPLPDGSKLYVTGGVISKVEAAEEMANDNSAAELQALLDQLFGEFKSHVATQFEAAKAENATSIETLKEELKAATEKIAAIEKANTEMFALVEKISDLPAVESAFNKKNGVTTPKTNSFKALADEARKIRAEFRNLNQIN